jgi:hypothetical protein
MGSGEEYSNVLCSVCLIKYYSGAQIKKNKIGWACGMNGRQERCIQGFGEETSWQT